MKSVAYFWKLKQKLFFITGKNKPLPLSVVVHDCDEPPCVVYKGQYAIMDVQFLGGKWTIWNYFTTLLTHSCSIPIDKNNLSNITTSVTARVLGMNLPYELPDEVSDVCTNLLYGAMCPIYKDEDVTYRFNFYIESAFPEITADVTVTLNDDNGDAISCFICSCKIRKGPSSRNDEQLLLESSDQDIPQIEA